MKINLDNFLLVSLLFSPTLSFHSEVCNTKQNMFIWIRPWKFRLPWECLPWVSDYLDQVKVDQFLVLNLVSPVDGLCNIQDSGKFPDKIMYWCFIPKAFANSADDLAFREVQKGIRKCARNKWFSGLLKSGKVLVSRWIWVLTVTVSLTSRVKTSRVKLEQSVSEWWCL